jgi:hypothetical protein
MSAISLMNGGCRSASAMMGSAGTLKTTVGSVACAAAG